MMTIKNKILRTNFLIRKGVPLLILIMTYIVLLVARNHVISCRIYHPSILIDAFELNENLNYSRILEHIEVLSSIGSRVTGYNGSYEAARYISSYFRSLNIQPGGIDGYLQPYELVVPIDYGSYIKITGTGEIFRAYALWPNGVQTCATPSEGITGKIIYVGHGSLENGDFDGKDIEGSIILLDFNSMDNWINAARLGAKAVIFIEPENTDYYESLRKFLDTPFYFPRIYVDKSVGYRLIEMSQREEEVTIFLNMKYTKATAYNVVGIVEGYETNDIIVLATHYDSWSVVPHLAQNAYESVSVALLLELARYFVEHKPMKTIWLVALSGHWQALAGAREFIREYYFSSDVQNGIIRPWIFVEIGPLSPDGRGLSLLSSGYFSKSVLRTEGIGTNYGWVTKLIRAYSEQASLSAFLKEKTGMTPREYISEYFMGGSGALWWGTEELPYMLDAEIAVSVGSVGFCITSSYSNKIWRGIPINNLKWLREEFVKLEPQILTMSFLICSFAFQRDWESVAPRWDQVMPKRVQLSPKECYGFITLRGKVLRFDLTEGWYKKVPYAIVRINPSVTGYPFAKIITMSDENGNFIVNGLAHSGWTYGGFVPRYIPGEGLVSGAGVGYYLVIDAWVIDQDRGAILCAPDQGTYGSYSIPPICIPMKEVEETSVVVFNLTSVTIFDLIHPGTLRDAVRDQRTWGSYGGGEIGSLIPLEILRGAELQFYGVFQNIYEPVSMLFVPNGSRIVISAPSRARPLFLITNASPAFPEGYGIIVNKDTVLHFTIYRAAYDMLSLANLRYERLKEYEVRRLSIERLLTEGTQHLLMADLYYSNKTYSKAFGEALIAFSIANQVYREVMSLYDDVSFTSLFFFAMLVCSSILLESLLFHGRGLLKLLNIIFISLVFFSIFYFIHPSLRVISSTLSGVIGAALIILFSLSIIIIISKIERLMKTVEQKILGIHRVEVGRIGSIMLGFSISIEYMRRHPFKTFLTMFTVVCISTAMVSLTSMSYTTEIRFVPQSGYKPGYNGILVMRDRGVPTEGPLKPYIVYYLRTIVGKDYAVFPRVWYYPQSIPPDLGPTLRIVVQKDSKIRESVALAALGLSSEESKHLVQKYFVAGFGFESEDQLACIISDSLSKSLNVSIGDQLMIFGKMLAVAGIINMELLSAEEIDLDGYPPTPVDPRYVLPLCRNIGYLLTGQEAAQYPASSWRDIIIIPYSLALKVYGYIGSISLRPRSDDVNEDSIMHLASKIAFYTDEDVYVCWNGNVYKCFKISTLLVLGWQYILPALIIGGLNVALTILSGTGERKKDIFIFSTVGASPTGVMTMFLTESLVYGVVGSAIGYFLGLFFNKFFIFTGGLPATFVFNFASVSIVLSLLTVIFFAIASVLYPIRSIGRLVTPSLKRKWDLPTRPVGLEWNVPLIAKFSNREEAYGFLHFIREYFEGRGAVTGSYRVNKLTDLNAEKLTLELIIDLVPYETKTSQLVRIEAHKEEKEYYISLFLKQLSGQRSVWINMNRDFIDDIRKQVLLWKVLPLTEAYRHIKDAIGGTQ